MDLRSLLSLPVLQHLLLPGADDVAAHTSVPESSMQACPLLSWENSGQTTARSLLSNKCSLTLLVSGVIGL